MPHLQGHMRAVVVAMEGSPADLGPIISDAVMIGVSSNPGGPLSGESVQAFVARSTGRLIPAEVTGTIVPRPFVPE